MRIGRHFGGSGIILTLFFLSACATTGPAVTEPAATVQVGSAEPESAYEQEVEAAAFALRQRPAGRETYAAGLAHALNAMRTAPDSLEAVLLVSDLSLRLSRIRDAIDVLESSYRSGIPGHEVLPERIAWLYARAGANTRAVDWYETAITHHPQDLNVRTGYVNALIRDGRFAEAREFVDQPAMKAILTLHMGSEVLEQNPELDMRDLVDEALAGLRSATAAERLDAAMLLSNLAVLYGGEDDAIPTGFYRTAAAVLEPVSETTTDPEPVWTLLAELYELVGEAEKAASVRERLRERPAY